MEVTVISPVFNEERGLRPLHERISAALEAVAPGRWELLLVDDGSIDGSRAVLAEIAAADARVIPLLQPRNRGQHRAVLAAMARARGELVVTIDGDLEDRPEDIPRVVTKLRAGFDHVGTWRPHRAGSQARRAASRLNNLALSAVVGLRVRDLGCSLRGYRRELVARLLPLAASIRFVPVAGAALARRYTELPIERDPRPFGLTRYDARRLARLEGQFLATLAAFAWRRACGPGVGGGGPGREPAALRAFS